MARGDKGFGSIIVIAALAGAAYGLYTMTKGGVGGGGGGGALPGPKKPGFEEIPDGLPPGEEVPPVYVPVPPGGYEPGPGGGVPPGPGPHEPTPPGRAPYFHIGNKIGVGSGQNYHVITIMWIDFDNLIYGYLIQTPYGAEPGEMGWDAFEAQYRGLPVW